MSRTSIKYGRLADGLQVGALLGDNSRGFSFDAVNDQVLVRGGTGRVPSFLGSLADAKSAGLITHTRASPTYRKGPGGILLPVSSGVPRINYLEGYAPQPSRMNRLLYSSDLGNAAWITTRTSLLTNQEIAPDGTPTADKLNDNGIDDSNGYIRQNFTWPGSTTYTFSAFLKYAEQAVAALGLIDGGGFAAFIDVNLITGAVVNVGGSSYVSSSILEFADGWFRVSLTGTPASGANSVRISHASGGGTDTDGFYVWGTQLEQNPQAFELVQTEGSTQTRAAEVMHLLTSRLFPNANDEWTIVAEYSAGELSTNVICGLSNAQSPNFNNVWWLNANQTTMASVSNRSDGANNGGINVSGSPGFGSVIKAATRYKAGDFGVSVNGAAAVTSTPSALPNAVMDRFTIGCSPWSLDNQGNMVLRRIALIPKAASNSELSSLSMAA